MTLHVNIEHVQYCCSVLSDVRFGNAGQGHYAMGRVVGAEPPDRRSISACECPPWQTSSLQALPSVADTVARRSLCLMISSSLYTTGSGINDSVPDKLPLSKQLAASARKLAYGACICTATISVEQCVLHTVRLSYQIPSAFFCLSQGVVRQCQNWHTRISGGNTMLHGWAHAH